MASSAGSALILSDAPVFSAAQRAQADSLLPEDCRGLADVCSRTSASVLKELPSSSYSVVLSLAECPGHHSLDLLVEIARLLKPGGSLILQEPVAARAPHTAEEQGLGKARLAAVPTQAALERLLLLSGFSSWSQGSPLQTLGLHRDWAGITPASVGSIQGPFLQPLLVKAEKPQWNSGATFSLKRKTAASASGASAAGASAPPAAPAPASWKVAGDDDGEELVDEDALLTAEDLQVPYQPARTAPGCDPSKPMRKACKNCTCGRAEMEAAAEGGAQPKKLTLDQLENPQSACGSCGLGDAFRCAGCPYRGLPPFKLGDKISLAAATLSADA